MRFQSIENQSLKNRVVLIDRCSNYRKHQTVIIKICVAMCMWKRNHVSEYDRFRYALLAKLLALSLVSKLTSGEPTK